MKPNVRPRETSTRPGWSLQKPSISIEVSCRRSPIAQGVPGDHNQPPRPIHWAGLLLVSSYFGGAIAAHLANHPFIAGGPFLAFNASSRLTKDN
jgi:hypothetical protein